MSERTPERPPAEELRLQSESRKIVCELLGHDWQRVRPREDTPIASIIGEHTLCVRCFKLDR